ncbi:inositol transport system permease protein [Paenibacillus sp. UNCCL117]|uniref:ABC transporter permease n=1 Tax=unclassified Paenibacillus TaxID=185978 RepID=UPI000880140F|nr:MULTISPECIES: ABC transporter permease [unclassified Paenibacillus]SDE10496.1 inositol transport system permease protein [Paenibacillus sp. cl123]SFW59780.1 inositol transport system permease protein [Paenibacillus sp. UNCCL117]
MLNELLLGRKAGSRDGAGLSAGMMRKYGLIVILLLAVIALSIVSDAFLTVTNIMNVLRQVSINGILAIGMTFIILTAGIDLSIGSMMAVSAVIAASIVNVNPDLAVVALLAGMLASGVLGGVSGTMSAKLNVAPFVATLAMMTIGRGIALIYTNGRPIVIDSPSFKFLGQGYIGPVPFPVVLFVAVAVLMSIVLYKTKFGRYIYAVGGNENAAHISGIRVSRVKIWVYIINGLLAGLAGAMLASRISSGQPNSGMGYELDAIAAVVIGGTSLFGGRGSMLGTIVGVLIIGVINNGLNLLDVSSYWQQIIKGVIIAGAVILDQRAKGK